jgi:hypothetical protein
MSNYERLQREADKLHAEAKTGTASIKSASESGMDPRARKRLAKNRAIIAQRKADEAKVVLVDRINYGRASGCTDEYLMRLLGVSKQTLQKLSATRQSAKTGSES